MKPIPFIRRVSQIDKVTSFATILASRDIGDQQQILSSLLSSLNRSNANSKLLSVFTWNECAKEKISSGRGRAVQPFQITATLAPREGLRVLGFTQSVGRQMSSSIAIPDTHCNFGPARGSDAPKALLQPPQLFLRLIYTTTLQYNHQCRHHSHHYSC